jgi:hypothetical protein
MLHQSQIRGTHRARLAVALGLLLTSFAATVTAAQADALVVDNADGTVQFTGSWQSASTTPGFYGGDYLFKVPGSGASLVRWPFPHAGAPGPYAVFARWTSGPNRASVVTYQVTSVEGTASVRRDQRTGGGQWYALGTYTFQPNQGQGVSLSDRADGVVVADAVIWVGPLDAGDTGLQPAQVAAANQLQRTVDEGDQPWRMDPLAVARADGVALGLSASDTFELLEVGAGVAKVRAQHASARYIIDLAQPARLGSTGIWVVVKVTRSPRG